MLQNNPMYAYLPAADVARAREFYEGKLGFVPGKELADGVTYTFGKGTACFLYPTTNAGTSKASQAFWQVDDIAREVAELKARGVRFERYDMPDAQADGDIVTAGGAKAAWFKDTEGNILALVQEL
ncbi:VOC family protein [Luteimonas sp. R10]|uniref:VOC family protein n=1 Tax=Luteimonas sp. R10 TaxID=3108176 RepID=UPI003090A0A2|nr:VOC family protein [Luteimonas sp. R10]